MNEDTHELKPIDEPEAESKATGDIESEPILDNRSEKQVNEVVRDERGRVISGTPNPAGRPKGAKNFTTKVKEALMQIADGTELTHEQLLIKQIMKKAIKDGNTAMIAILWEQMDGKPTQRVINEFDNEVESVTVTIVNSHDQLKPTRDTNIQ